MTAKQMADAWGASQNHVQGVCKDLNINPLPVRYLYDDFVKANHSTMTIYQMADLSGAPKDTIYSVCKRLGLKPKPMKEPKVLDPIDEIPQYRKPTNNQTFDVHEYGCWVL